MERALKLLKLKVTGREPLLVVVLGPTASGKTALALAIARRFRGEIVNCDSVAMYREFEIGTAKPSAAERAEVPHHLLDCVDPLADISAGEYARQARQVLREIALRESERRKHLPIVSGGTGLYLRALLEGLFPGPQRSEDLRNKLRGRAEKHGTEHLHRILRRLDADVPKVIRAIEVCLASRPPSRRTSRRTMTELWQEGREPLRGFRILRLGLNPDREALYARINQRAAKMFDQGLIAETEALLAKYLAAAQQAHRNYAKRQITWFRREPDVHWLTGFGDNAAIQAEGIATVERQI